MEIVYLRDKQELASLIQTALFVVVDFYSTDCPPCEKLAPIFERLSKHYGMVQFVKVFRQEHRELAEEYEVRSSPTLLFFYRGNMQAQRLSGEIKEVECKSMIDGMLRQERMANVSETKPRQIETRDLCIIGSGPAALSASIYASRYHVDHVVVGELAGGLMTTSHKICNYPSENEISGMDLTKKMVDHVQHLGAPMRAETVEAIQKKRQLFEIRLSNGDAIHARAVLLAIGTKHRCLGLKGEERFIGRGLSYCATCDAAFYRGKTVAVVGGSDSANTASLYLSDIASRVYQIYRGHELRGETAWIDQISKKSNITIFKDTNVKALDGDTTLRAIEIDRGGQGTQRLEIDGLFVEIGSDPDAALIEQLKLKTDEKGFVVTRSDQRTNRAGVWAAGDITTGSDGFRQIVTACSEGAIAARSIFYALKSSATRGA